MSTTTTGTSYIVVQPNTQQSSFQYGTAVDNPTKNNSGDHGPSRFPVGNVANYVYVTSRAPVILSSCPKCSTQNVQTKTRTKITGRTWVITAAGFLLCWPICWIPLVIDPTKQTNHFCSCCGVKVGRVKPF